VMGMGRTSEELQDLANVIDVASDGTVTSVPISELRQQPAGPTPMADVVEQKTAPAGHVDEETGEVHPEQPKQQQAGGAQDTGAASGAWEPSPEEQEAIRLRELAESGHGQAGAATTATPTGRRPRASATPME
jgi:hypothetical protein